eukprot:297964-Pleurochrysis_carterae.AAC.2
MPSGLLMCSSAVSPAEGASNVKAAGQASSYMQLMLMVMQLKLLMQLVERCRQKDAAGRKMKKNAAGRKLPTQLRQQAADAAPVAASCRRSSGSSKLPTQLR